MSVEPMSHLRQPTHSWHWLMFLVVLVIAIGSSILLEIIDDRYRKMVNDSLQTVANEAESAMRVWARDHLITARRLANDPHIQQAAKILLATEKKQQSLLNSPAQLALRAEFESLLLSKQYQGFFIIDRDLLSLASSRDFNVNIPNLLKVQPDIIERLWQGETVISRVQPSDFAFSHAHGPDDHYHGASGKSGTHQHRETLFVGSPIKDEKGEPIALLTLRIDPYATLFRLMEQGRIGDTGETYAFDHHGVMLSESRFTDQLTAIGLLGNDTNTLLNLRLADPGYDLTRMPEKLEGLNLEQQPLTLMAATAITEQDGCNSEGYRDYRGVEVIGCWRWIEDLGIGIASEQDTNEAFAVLYAVENYMIASAALVGLLFIIMISVFVASRRKIESFNEQLRTMSLIAESTDNAVILTDANGYIRWVNAGYIEVSGYTLAESVGKKPGSILQGPDTDPELVEALSIAIKKGEKISGEILNYHKSGTPYWVKFEINPVFDEKGVLIEFVALEEDVTEEKRLLRNLHQQKIEIENANHTLTITQQALERTGIAEFWIDAETGQLLRINDQACNHLGYSRDELLQMSVPDFDPVFSHELFREKSAELQLQGWSRFESTHQTLHGKQVPVEVTSIYVASSEHCKQMLIAFVTDITERKQVEQALKSAKLEAEEANRAKSTFLATMSHEIRTPLNGIVGTIDVLRHTDINQSQRDLLGTAFESSMTLAGIIDDILDFSKIEAGRMELQREVFALESLVEGVGETLQTMASQKKIELLVYCDPLLPNLIGDSIRLRQVLFNLLGNAIKFTDNSNGQGRVSMSALLKNRRQNQVELCLQVADNGIGMSSEVQNRLFKPFVQGEDSTSRRFGGTGLGLVITKRIVEMMGGQMALESQPGKGTTFRISLWLDAVKPLKPEVNNDLEGLQVMVVEKDQDIGHMLTSYLSFAHAVVTPTQPESALNDFEKIKPAVEEIVVIVDSQPSAPAAEQLRQQLSESAGDISLRFVLVERGKRRHVRKLAENELSIDLNAMRRKTLINAVAAAAGRQQPDYGEQEPSLMLAPSSLSSEQAAEQSRLILVVDDNLVNLDVLSTQLDLLGYVAHTAENGEQALQMWRDSLGAESTHYSLVITDCHMPVMDGYELAAAIRAEEQEGRIPILAFTADALKGTAERCYTAGMDGYLSKPAQLREIQASMEKWLNQPAAEIIIDEPVIQTDEKTFAVIDPTVLPQLLGIEDEHELVGYYQDFLDSAQDIMEEIKLAHDQSQLVAVGEAAHKLKSSAKTVGADDLAECSAALEQAGKAQNGEEVVALIQQLYAQFDLVKDWIKSRTLG